MRIVHVITGLNNGGAEGALFRLVTTDKKDTHHVIALMGSGVYGARLSAAGIPVTVLNMPRRHVTLSGLTKLHRLIRSIDPDVVQTWLYHSDFVGGLLARLAGKPVVWGIRNTIMDPARAARSTKLMVALCARTSGWLPRRVVSCSVQAAREHVDVGYRRDKMVVIANGFDVSEIGPEAKMREQTRAELGVAPDTRLLGMVARYDPQKDHANLAAALELLASQNIREWRCVMAGADVTALNAELLALLDRHGVRERCLLLGPRTDVPAIMNGLDLHILSSAYGEAFPNVVAEAMACGTPCVVTDIGDAALIVADTGWVVPGADPISLARAVGEALSELEHAAQWDARRAAARQRIAAEFDMDRMVNGYRKVWRAALTREIPR